MAEKINHINQFTYSVAVRTLGTAGEKYKALLDSIEQLDPKPEKVVVVLPHGYDLPKERLGWEEFVFSPKGMIHQRMEALRHITSEYVLFCDDDVAFPSDFAEKLAAPLQDGTYDCAAGPLLDFFPPAGLKYVLASALGGACRMLWGRDKTYVRILNTGGWSYNRFIDTAQHRIYETESLPGTCFFVRTKTVRAIRFEEEAWLERSGYAAFEDRVMFYKMVINGFRCCVVSDALYAHNDGKTSVKGLRLEPEYAAAFNHYVFWHRFLYAPAQSGKLRLWRRLCIRYYIGMQKLYKSRNPEVYHAVAKGFRDAVEYVHSEEYGNLPSIYIHK